MESVIRVLIIKLSLGMYYWVGVIHPHVVFWLLIIHGLFNFFLVKTVAYFKLRVISWGGNVVYFGYIERLLS